MAQVLEAYKIPHEHEAVAAEQTGLHVGRDGIAQTHLSAQDTVWMEGRVPPATTRAPRTTTTSTPTNWPSVEELAFKVAFALLAISFALLVLRLLYQCCCADGKRRKASAQR